MYLFGDKILHTGDYQSGGTREQRDRLGDNDHPTLDRQNKVLSTDEQRNKTQVGTGKNTDNKQTEYKQNHSEMKEM